MSSRQPVQGVAPSAQPSSVVVKETKGEFQLAKRSQRNNNRAATKDDVSTNAASRSSSSSSASSVEVEAARTMASLKATAAAEQTGPHYIPYTYSNNKTQASAAGNEHKTTQKAEDESKVARYDYSSKLLAAVKTDASQVGEGSMTKNTTPSTMQRANQSSTKTTATKGPTFTAQTDRREMASLLWDLLYAQIGFKKEELDNLRNDESLAPSGGKGRLVLGEGDTVADDSWTDRIDLNAARARVTEHLQALEALRDDNNKRHDRKFQTKSFVDDKRHDALRAREAELAITSKKIAALFKKIDLSDRGLKTVSEGVLDFVNIEQLILSANHLTHLPYLPEKVRILVANGNELQTVLAAPLNQPRIAEHLVFVSLVDNQLSSLAFVAYMPKLRVLDASYNEINIIEDATDPITDGGAPFLSEVSLTGNPIALLPRYRQLFVAQAPQVKLLDGVPTGVAPSSEAVQNGGAIDSTGSFHFNRHSQSVLPTSAFSPSPPRGGGHGSEPSKPNPNMSAQQIQQQQLQHQQQAQLLFAQQLHQQQILWFQHLQQQEASPENLDEVVIQLNINKLCGLPTLALPTYVAPPTNPDGTPMLPANEGSPMMGASTNVASTIFGYSTNTAAPINAQSIRGKDLSGMSTGGAKGGASGNVNNKSSNAGPTPPKAPAGGGGVSGRGAGATNGPTNANLSNMSNGPSPGGLLGDGGMLARAESKTTFSLFGISPHFAMGNPTTVGGIIFPPPSTITPSLSPVGVNNPTASPTANASASETGVIDSDSLSPLLFAEDDGVATLIKDADTIIAPPVDEDPTPVAPVKGKGAAGTNNAKGGGAGAKHTGGGGKGASNANAASPNQEIAGMASNLSAISGDGEVPNKGAEEETALNLSHTISIPQELLAPTAVGLIMQPIELVVAIRSHVLPQVPAHYMMGLSSPPTPAASASVLSPSGATGLRGGLSPITFTEPPTTSLVTARPSSQPQQFHSPLVSTMGDATAASTVHTEPSEEDVPYLTIPPNPPSTEIIGSFLIDTSALIDVSLATEGTCIIGGGGAASQPNGSTLTNNLLTHATRYLALEDIPLTIDPLFITRLKHRIEDLNACVDELVAIDKKLSVALNEMAAALSPPSSPPAPIGALGGQRTSGVMTAAGNVGFAGSPTAGAKPGSNSIQRRASITPSMLAMQQQQMAAAAAQQQNSAAYQELAKAQKESAQRKAHISEIQKRISVDMRRLAKVNDIKVTLSGLLAINPAPLPPPDSRQLLTAEGGAPSMSGPATGAAGAATTTNKSKPPKAR